MPKAPPPGIWKCHACGELFNAWAKAQRHADEHGHGRIECVIRFVRK